MDKSIYGGGCLLKKLLTLRDIGKKFFPYLVPRRHGPMLVPGNELFSMVTSFGCA